MSRPFGTNRSILLLLPALGASIIWLGCDNHALVAADAGMVASGAGGATTGPGGTGGGPGSVGGGQGGGATGGSAGGVDAGGAETFSPPQGACPPSACDGLAATADAEICPDGTELGRTSCARGTDGACRWDFPACPVTVPAQPLPECPLVPSDPTATAATGCPLVGRWVLNSNHGTVSSLGVIEFTNVGSYYGGPSQIDLSKTYAYDGAYRYTSTGATTGSFQLVFSCGDGCNGSGDFGVTFQDACAVAVLEEHTTQCTGNRIAVAGKVVLTRQ